MEKPPEIVNEEVSNPEVFLDSQKNDHEDRWKTILSHSTVGLGSAIVLAGIYEFVTGQKIPDISSLSEVPNIVESLYNNLRDMPLLLKTGGGASLITLSQFFQKR